VFLNKSYAAVKFSGRIIFGQVRRPAEPPARREPGKNKEATKYYIEIKKKGW
jgi:hypothetical protein